MYLKRRIFHGDLILYFGKMRFFTGFSIREFWKLKYFANKSLPTRVKIFLASRIARRNKSIFLFGLTASNKQSIFKKKPTSVSEVIVLYFYKNIIIPLPCLYGLFIQTQISV